MCVWLFISQIERIVSGIETHLRCSFNHTNSINVENGKSRRKCWIRRTVVLTETLNRYTNKSKGRNSNEVSLLVQTPGWCHCYKSLIQWMRDRARKSKIMLCTVILHYEFEFAFGFSMTIADENNNINGNDFRTKWNSLTLITHFSILICIFLQSFRLNFSTQFLII